jgi:hypothetical protein
MKMKYTTLGKTGLTVSVVGLGGIPIQKTDVNGVIAVIDACIEEGINYIDTARAYTVSEEYLGAALEGRRERFIIATKSMARTYEAMKADIEKSLANLRTDYIDLYQIHYRDGVTSIADVLEVLEQLRGEGKIRYFGLSNIHREDIPELENFRGKFLSFQNPDIMGDIAESGLAKFIPQADMQKIYGDAYLGRYSGAQQIEIANTPIIDTTGMDAAPTISATVVKDSSNNVIGLEPIKTATGSGTGSLIVGAAYKVTGLKIRNAAGIETDRDYVIIWGKEKQGANTVYGIPALRITSQGKGYNNANAWMDATTLAAAISSGTATFTLTPLLTASKKYAIGQVRTEDSLKWDQYRFDGLPGSEDQDVSTFENVTLKLMAFGDGKNGVKLLRIDLPYLAKILEHRESVTTYLQLN